MSVMVLRPRPAMTVLCSFIFPDLEVTDWEEGSSLPTISCQGSPRQIWEPQTLFLLLVCILILYRVPGVQMRPGICSPVCGSFNLKLLLTVLTRLY